MLNALVEKHHRWGSPKCFKHLRKLGHRWNQKRVHRVYTELKLNLRRKTKRPLPARNPEPLAVPNSPDKSWSMDLMSDSLHNKVHFRTFNVIDDSNREVSGIDVATSMSSLRVIRYLDQIAEWHGYPERSGWTTGANSHQVYLQIGLKRRVSKLIIFNLAALIRMLILKDLIEPVETK